MRDQRVEPTAEQTSLDATVVSGGWGEHTLPGYWWRMPEPTFEEPPGFAQAAVEPHDLRQGQQQMRTPVLLLTARWVARTWSIASIGLLCAFLFGEGLPSLTIKSVLFPFGVMFGLVVAWRFERTGGAVAALSVLSFYALEYLSQGRFPRGPWFLLIAAPGLLFILSGYIAARITSRQGAEARVSDDA